MWKSHLQPVNMEKGLCCGACVYHTQHGQKKEEKMYGGKTMPINYWKWTDDESQMDIATCKHKQMDSKSAHKNSSWFTNITYLIYNTIYLSMLNVFNVPVSTVCNIVKKFTACGTGADHPWRGRKRRIYERLQQRIVWTLDIEPPSTSKQIQVVLQTPGTTVSARTIRCHLNKKGHDGRRPRRIPLLTQEKKKKKEARWWRFTDVLGCFAASGAGCLDCVYGNMKSEDYQRIPWRNNETRVRKLGLRQRSWVLQQDDDA